MAGEDRKGSSLAGTPGETPLFTKLSYLAMTGNWKPTLSYLVLKHWCLPYGWHQRSLYTISFFKINKHRAQTRDLGKNNLVLPTFLLASGLDC